MKDYKEELKLEINDHLKHFIYEKGIIIQAIDFNELKDLILFYVGRESKEKEKVIAEEKSENERLIKDGQYLTEQINLKNEVIEAAIKWRNDTQTISIEECCPGIIEKCDECELVRAIDKYIDIKSKAL